MLPNEVNDGTKTSNFIPSMPNEENVQQEQPQPSNVKLDSQSGQHPGS